MIKKFKDSKGNTGVITSNFKYSNFKYLNEFTDKQQLDILDNFDYLPEDEIKDLLLIDTFTSLNDILLLNSCWTSTDEILERVLYDIVNKDNNYFNVGFISNAYKKDYYAVDTEGYIKLHVKYND